MNPNMMNRNISYYGANRKSNNCGPANGCDTNCSTTDNCNTNCGDGQPHETCRMQTNCGGRQPREICRTQTNCGGRQARETCRPQVNCGNMQSREMCRPQANCGGMKHENIPCNKYMEADCQQLESMNQQQLLSYLNQVSFSMYDTVLFLDTHPCHQEAMANFQEMKHARMHALEIYQKKFGPLLLDDVDADCEWTWGMQPLPWEPMC